MKDLTCVKCSGKMEAGNYSGNAVDWQKEDDKSFLQKSGEVITTYACAECGYIESYVKRS